MWPVLVEFRQAGSEGSGRKEDRRQKNPGKTLTPPTTTVWSGGLITKSSATAEIVRDARYGHLRSHKVIDCYANRRSI